MEFLPTRALTWQTLRFSCCLGSGEGRSDEPSLPPGALTSWLLCTVMNLKLFTSPRESVSFNLLIASSLPAVLSQPAVRWCVSRPAVLRPLQGKGGSVDSSDRTCTTLCVCSLFITVLEAAPFWVLLHCKLLSCTHRAQSWSISS